VKSTMPCILAIWLLSAIAAPVFGQGRVFQWLPANDESVRLDPAYYHTGRTYHPASSGGSIHVDIRAQKPITVFLVPAEQWSLALENPGKIGDLQRLCLREHVVETTYLCDLPGEPMTLVLQDERASLDPVVHATLGAVLDRRDKSQRAVGAAVEAVLGPGGAVSQRFASPNDAFIQYYRWACVENCIQPEYRWFREIKEKYGLTSFLKLYGGFAPDHDGALVRIKVKSPVPMVVAMVPSSLANQLHARPETFDAALATTNCQQRGVQSLQFDCTFDLSDGPQSLIVAPESKSSLPKGKKAEIEMSAVECTANCSISTDKP